MECQSAIVGLSEIPFRSRIYNSGWASHFFKHNEFWYYNQQIYPETFQSELLVKNANPLQRIEKSDLVILLSNDANLYKFPFGFEDILKDTSVWVNSKDVNINPKFFKRLTEGLNNKDSLSKSIELLRQKEALSASLKTDTSPKKVAEYLIQYHADYQKENYIYNLMDTIQQKPSLMELIKEKAKKNNISLEEAVYKDAVWIYSQKEHSQH